MTSILLVDDHQIVLDGLLSYLADEPDLDVVGQAMNGHEAIEQVRQLSPAIVVMDISMPDLNGIDATRLIKKSHPRTRIIGLSTYTENRFVLDLMRKGASGYLPKKCAARELVTAIHTVLLGQTYLSPEVAGDVMKELLDRPDQESDFGQLSGREREVLQLIAEGSSMKEIAHCLAISLKTAHTHRQHIMQKLDLHSVAELTKFALREGLTTL